MEKTAFAYLKGLRMAPRKVGLVASLVRGRNVADALVILQHTPKRAAKSVAKVIESAKANAVNNHGLQDKDMVIQTITVTAGERLKRFRPAAHGRALAFQRKSSNIRVVVVGTVKPKKSPKASDKKEEVK